LGINLGITRQKNEAIPSEKIGILNYRKTKKKITAFLSFQKFFIVPEKF